MTLLQDATLSGRTEARLATKCRCCIIISHMYNAGQNDRLARYTVGGNDVAGFLRIQPTGLIIATPPTAAHEHCDTTNAASLPENTVNNDLRVYVPQRHYTRPYRIAGLVTPSGEQQLTCHTAAQMSQHWAQLLSCAHTHPDVPHAYIHDVA